MIDRARMEPVVAGDDLGRLVDCLRGRLSLGGEELGLIERRAAGASPRPWRVFLESDGGIGGSDVIAVSDRADEPDLSIWRGADLAPDPDFELVGVARNEIPELLKHLRTGDR